MFTLKMPHMLFELPNPVFNLELQQVRRLRTPDRLLRFSRRVLLFPFLLVLAWWLLSVWGFATTTGVQKYQVYRTYFYISNILVIVLFFAMPVAILVTDFYALAITINSISHEMETGQSDLLRMTPLKVEDYVAAKHGVTQVRAWRVMAFEVAVRMLFVVMMIVWTTFEDTCSWGYYFSYTQYQCHIQVHPAIDQVVSGLSYDPWGTLMSHSMLILIIVTLIAEPLWRMRVMTAIGLAISTRIRNASAAALTAFAVIVLVHVAQVIIFIAITQLGVDISPYREMQTAQLFVVTMGVIAAFAGFYRLLYSIALNDARRRAFRPE